jgi:hypothetical protein
MKFVPRLALPLILSVTWAAPSLASLGGSLATVEADRQHVVGAVQKSSPGLYDVHEITTAAGTIREYVTRGGKVFAVAWSTRLPPDLQQLLGDNYAQFAQGAAAQPQTRNHLNVVLPGLEVHSAGRMRGFSGRAWLPDQMPAGVSPTDVR